MRFAVLLLLLASCGTTRHLPAEGTLGPYSGSVVSGGFVFVSGKIGTRGGSFSQELQTALDAVEAELGRSGLDLGDTVDVTVYLTDMALYAEFNDIYARRFPVPHPARTTVGVQSLPGDARVEIDVVARRAR